MVVAVGCAHTCRTPPDLTLRASRVLGPAGNGRSQKPNLLDRSTWWTVDTHFQQDVPAVLEYVLAATGAKQVHWVGHSM